jgi:hypothetical protein
MPETPKRSHLNVSLPLPVRQMLNELATTQFTTITGVLIHLIVAEHERKIRPEREDPILRRKRMQRAARPVLVGWTAGKVWDGKYYQARVLVEDGKPVVRWVGEWEAHKYPAGQVQGFGSVTWGEVQELMSTPPEPVYEWSRPPGGQSEFVMDEDGVVTQRVGP